MSQCLYWRLGTIVLLLAIVASRPASAVTIDFNSPTDLNQFTVFGLPVELTSGGVMGSAIRVQNSNLYPSTRLVYNQSLPYLNIGEEIVTSMMFHYDQLVQVSNGGGVGVQLAQLHLLSDPNFSATTQSIAVDCSASQQTPSDPITFSVRASRLLGGSGNGVQFAIDPLVHDHWYQLNATFTSTPTFLNGVEVQLTDFGVDGQTFSGNVLQQTLQYSGPPLIRDPTVWAAFRFELARDHGTDRADDFTITIVPEPGALTLAAMALGLLGLRRRMS